MSAWLDVVGIGEDGVAGLAAPARAALAQAGVIVGGDRHHRLTPDIPGERVAWPSPFDALIGLLRDNRHRRPVVLATGDPLWFSVGARIVKALGAGAIRFHPQLSAFQWAACRLGWSLADVETLTAHGRPTAQVVPCFWPGARLLILTAGPETPHEIARALVAHGYGASRMTVLANLGGPEETRIDTTAEQAGAGTFPPFHVLAVACRGTPETLLPRVPGLADTAFETDGCMTKREVRAITLAKLMPSRGAVLWDVGCGSGSVGIEWMRAAPDAIALGLDPNPERLARAQANAETLGAPRLTLIEGRAPEALSTIPAPEGTKPDLRRPDAVFLGGGLSGETVAAAFGALAEGGRLVANAVTLEGEAVLLAARATHGGELVRLCVARAEPVGGFTGWRPAMPVTQWSLVKR